MKAITQNFSENSAAEIAATAELSVLTRRKVLAGLGACAAGGAAAWLTPVPKENLAFRAQVKFRIDVAQLVRDMRGLSRPRHA